MALAIGSRLGPYEILSALGAGGMGEVYRATDTRLKRAVALKVLPDAFAGDPDRMARVQREAEVLASLNHPHIAHLYGIERHEGTAAPFLVMELVEGEDLAARVSRGPIPLLEALPIARQVAEALEAAHEKGVIHRDLKPGNIMVTPDGVVKVLDFGLAKALDPGDAARSANLAASPTLTAASLPGVILGTAAYMAPEQAKGKPVDKRADIWAFGCVLFEMLTGRRAFEGEDVSETLAFVLTKEPAWKLLPAELPSEVGRLLRRCLEKDPKRRLRDIGEARIAIDEAVSNPKPEASRTAAPSSTSRFAPWIVAAALLAAAIPAAWMLKPTATLDRPLLELEISPPDGVRFTNWGDVASPTGTKAFSPDGRHLVFRGTSSDARQTLWLRTLDSGAAVSLPGTEGASGAFWSPDSRWLAFTAGGRLEKISIPGGQPQFICNASPVSGTWNAEGVILFWERGKPIQRVSASGGTPTTAIDFDESRGEDSQADPQFLPDGRRFIYSSSGKERGFFGLVSLDSKERKYFFLTLNSPPQFVTNPAGGGWILFIVQNRLFARAFDPDKAEFTSDAVALTDPLVNGPTWSASANGFLAFRRNEGTGRQFTWFGRDGKPTGTIAHAGAVRAPRISPDGKTVAFDSIVQQNTDVYLFDVTDSRETRFTLDPGRDSLPVWTPDGQALVYYSERGSDRLLVERPVGKLGDETLLFKEPANGQLFPGGLSRDGRLLAVSRSTGASAGRLFVLSRPGGTPLPVEGDITNGQHGEISPDGRWLLYSAISGLRRDVFAQFLPGDERGRGGVNRKQISFAGGIMPAWRRDGKEIYYVAEDGQMMAASVESGDDFFRVGAPRALFQTQLTTVNVRDYDVTADGQRFLIPQPQEAVGEKPITVIVNWPKLLQK